MHLLKVSGSEVEFVVAVVMAGLLSSGSMKLWSQGVSF